MSHLKTKHFQYTGMDDYDKSIDLQINEFINENKIDLDSIVDIKYAAHSSQEANTYSALMVYMEG